MSPRGSINLLGARKRQVTHQGDAVELNLVHVGFVENVEATTASRTKKHKNYATISRGSAEEWWKAALPRQYGCHLRRTNTCSADNIPQLKGHPLPGSNLGSQTKTQRRAPSETNQILKRLKDGQLENG